MPELPEVETVRRGLEPILAGRRLTRVEARRPDLREPLPKGFVQRLTGARGRAVGAARQIHARASRPGRDASPAPGHERSLPREAAERGRGGRSQARARRFHHGRGSAPPLRRSEAFWSDRSHIDQTSGPGWAVGGPRPEPLAPDFSSRHLLRAFGGSRQSIKTRLLDQRVVAGLGNIYACEALHRARIHPAAAAGEISAAAISRLVRAVREVLAKAIAAGGSTLRDFAHTNGAIGSFQHEFAVYDRAGAPCSRRGCGGSIVRIVQTGRSTFFCPACQR